MARKAEELYKAALALSAEEREELKRLLSMQPDSGYASPEIEKAWMDEIERRERDLAEGRDKWIPGDEVMRELRERYSK
jgi:hypothetical protein